MRGEGGVQVSGNSGMLTTVSGGLVTRVMDDDGVEEPGPGG